jgi:hypothetical protein
MLELPVRLQEIYICLWAKCSISFLYPCVQENILAKTYEPITEFNHPACYIKTCANNEVECDVLHFCKT